MEKTHDYLFKIILLGDSGVGKTSLMRRYTDNSFLKDPASTIGVDFKIKTVELDGKRVKLQIWDTAGQERFRAIVAHYYRGAHGILLVFDTHSKSSFENMRAWFEELRDRSVFGSAEIVVLGNKADISSPPAVSTEEVEAFLKAQGIAKPRYYEVSAQSGQNVEAGFLGLARQLVQQAGAHTNTQSSKPSFGTARRGNSCC